MYVVLFYMGNVKSISNIFHCFLDILCALDYIQRHRSCEFKNPIREMVSYQTSHHLVKYILRVHKKLTCKYVFVYMYIYMYVFNYGFSRREVKP